MQDISVDICVCTFRRGHLTDTLQSLAKLELQPDWQVQVIVADNDETPSARSVVTAAQNAMPFPVRYIHAPARNISVARNACLAPAAADFLAFIDDDELASPQWLSKLMERYRQTQADAVLGPVQALYPATAPAWIQKGNYHSIKPVWVNDQIITGYTSNVLFRREAPALKDLRFDPALGRSGGEDTIFFAALHKAGGRIDYAPDAVVLENVAPERLNFLWLLKRSFRSGQTHGLMVMKRDGAGFKSRFSNALPAGCKALICGGAALGMALKGRGQAWLIRGALHLGVVARLLGLSELTQYG